MKAAQPVLLSLKPTANPLRRFEQAPPNSREALLKLWQELAPSVRAADPARYFAVQEALAQEVPFSVLALYVFRECRRALERPQAQRRAE
ncbi:MAG: hypothetical protein NZ849_06840 [Meiothermus sp.]|uniref:hypothetical protein n=1 Tax=Meiothermus sp. TaxID=1955249 RepID=UPI0025D9B30D|nr:hypothetical protein [Meiothermus sp.]MCS7057765.1 hypothetical protein [Meiothermus sp.]MCS7194608.1 hypothetical protein [Meiothermus sp.]MCX7740797.1 hypothetical protein [Meiothermus sp.]MDW8090983.1 hypothetical protein [Meiothermus sp.]MDW8481878.1 hypothetical protein [Meiothermus sp.]